jgi:hypothetical protein
MDSESSFSSLQYAIVLMASRRIDSDFKAYYRGFSGRFLDHPPMELIRYFMWYLHDSPKSQRRTVWAAFARSRDTCKVRGRIAQLKDAQHRRPGLSEQIPQP